MLSAVLLMGLIGCQNTNWPNWRLGSPTTEPAVPVPTTAPPAQDAPTPLSDLTLRPIVIQTVHFAILRVLATPGTFSNSEKIWNPIDEEVLPAETRMMLRNNGLRVGVGKHASWPQIKAALDAEKVEVITNEQVLQNGVPLNIEINPQPRDQTVFLIRSDGSMPGAFFPQSTTVLRIEYWIPPERPDSVMIELMPEIRLPRTAGQSNMAAAALQAPNSGQPSRPLREMITRIRVNADEFLVVGPSRVTQQPHLVGALLLTEEVDGRKLESMCFITTKILSVPQTPTP
ncbi:MAG TPA: hypothetical protein VLM89_07080 [Phycisphaerae bacterium]|nr:hypothetical protein [Phycisphaerae bacterium]